MTTIPSLLIPIVLFQYELVSSACIASANQCGCPTQPPAMTSSRIVGGYPARKHSWPWIVSIRETNALEPVSGPGKAICAGSLINKKYVLTAAHCLYEAHDSLLSDYFVVVGAHHINDTNLARFQIRSVTIHENYDHDLFSYDIALLELSTEVDLQNATVGVLCLPSTKSAAYPCEQTVGVAIGWGRTAENGSMSYILQQVYLPIISNDNPICRQLISDNRLHLCAGVIQGGKDTCQGDSGGPLMMFDDKTSTWHMAGITSYGFGCAQAGHLGVYTRVSVLVDWINAHAHSSSSSAKASAFVIPLLLFLVCNKAFF